MPILNDIIDASRFLKLTDDDLLQITSELQQNPYVAFGLESNVTLQQLRLLTLRYVNSFDPDQHSAATADQKTKICQVSELINTSRDALINPYIQKINEAFLEAIHLNDANQIGMIWENCADELSEQSLIAFAAYAKTKNDAALRKYLEGILTNKANLEFGKNRAILIGKALRNLDKYDQFYIKGYLEELLSNRQEKYRLVCIAILRPYFNEVALKLLLDWPCLGQKNDWVFVIAQGIKENNYQAVDILLDKGKAIGILGETKRELDSFLKEVVEVYQLEFPEDCDGQQIYKSTFAKYSNEQRSAILIFFSKHNNPHFSVLLRLFKELSTKDILEIMRNCLESDVKKHIEKKFEWHASMTGNTILHFFVSLIPSGHERYLCQVLNEYKKYINKANNIGETPLNIACQIHKNSSDLSIVKKLLELGASPNVFDAAGNSPLMIAVKNGNIELLGLLMVNKALPQNFNKLGESAISLINACQDDVLKTAMRNILLKHKNVFEFLKRKPFPKSAKTKKSWPTTGIFPKDILKNDLERAIFQGKAMQFLSMICDNYALLANNLNIIEEILPRVIDRGNIAMLNGVLERFHDKGILMKDSEFIKKLFCYAIKKGIPEIVGILLNFVTKEYCQQEEVQQLIAATAKNNTSLTMVINGYSSSEPIEIVQLNSSSTKKRKCSKEEEEESESESTQSEEENPWTARGFGLC